jgi:hypothetical protein
MPGIFIGIGGIGGSIVAKVRDALDVKVQLAGATPSALQSADQFRFMLLDTWKDGVSGGFDAAQVFDLPEGKDKFEVDAKIDSWWRSGDPSFRTWWPKRRAHGVDTGSPLMAGPYASGAGQLRVKGRLAYRISLTGLGRQSTPAVLENLREIDAVLGPSTSIRTVPVYLVCSLGGGSGSGMALTFAHHLRETLPEYCPIIGVFPLGSVTELGPGAADSSSVWANTDSALREIDYCQRVAGTPDNQLAPFFQWPGQGNVIFGKQRPFEYVYLFGRDNQSGQSLTEFSKYVELISETLIAESFASLVDEGLQNAIRGPHSQFIMQLQARPEVGGRPTTYASAAVGSLVFPTERVERHLARRFAIDVLAKMANEDDAIVSSEIDDFMQRQALVWNGKPAFGPEFDKPITEQPSGKLRNRPVFGNPLVMTSGSQFAKAAPSAAVPMAIAAAEQLNAYAGKQLEHHYQQRRQEIREAFSSPKGHLRTAVVRWLTDGGPSALGLAYEAVTGIRSRLEAQWRQLNDLIEGNPDTGAEGLKKTLEKLQEDYPADAARMQRGSGGGLSRAFGQGGKTAKEKFLKGPYRTLQDRTIELQKMLAARQTYRELTVETIRMQRVLKELKENADQLRQNLERQTETDVGEHGRSGVLDLAVLDDPRLLAHHFHELLEETRRLGVDACATLVTAPPKDANDPSTLDASLDVDGELLEHPDALATTGVVLETFNRLLDPLVGSSTLTRDRYIDQLENAIVSDGVNRLGRRVREMSIWDALAAECKARTALNLHDVAVEQAEREITAQRQNAEDAGVPAKDWEHQLLQFFIRRRLEECQKRVRPFWNLNGLMTANFGQPYSFVVLATDEKAYRIAETKHGIKGSLDQIADLMQAGTPKWLPGKDRITLYSREGVAPLFYLNDRELKVMRDSSAQKAQDKFLYIDARFEKCVDQVIRPGESRNEQLLYAIGMGLELGIIKWVDTGSLNGGVHLELDLGGEPRTVGSMAELKQLLDDNPETAEHLKHRVDEEMQALPQDQQYARPFEAQIAVAALLGGEGGHPLSEDDTQVLIWVEQAILQRMNLGQAFVNA